MRTALMSLIVASLWFGCESSPQTEDSGKPFKFLLDWQAEPTYLGIYLGKARGGFARLGLDVEIVQSWGRMPRRLLWPRATTRSQPLRGARQ